ncbi:MAG: 1-deoxy-D-xylulose-5-phosphate synthase, partial [Oscillospiraceae bacterium]|nr:1-deoxy-D-xylulose-5-phosphate synthase [Oscillospiraceae bacterium]
LGPVDGHNLEALEEALRSAKKLKRPVFVHVNTIKGKGYKPAELNPGAFHAVPSSGYNRNNPNNSPTASFSEEFGKGLCRLADNDDRICAITAAMKYGTGLQHFASKFEERFYDVGIAEQHAVTFAAGLAKEGQIPVFAVYSSFLQRSYDQLVHDAAIDNTHIVLAVDRAGFVGEDGETHQGLLDVPMLSTIPNTTIYSPSTYAELNMCLNKSIYKDEGVVAVRYPKGAATASIYADDTTSFSITKNNSRKLAVSYGRIVHNLYTIDSCDILKLVKIFPIELEILEICMEYDEIFFFEESSKSGGIGEKLLAMLYSNGYKGRFVITAVDSFVKQCSVERCMEKYCLDSTGMRKIIDMSESVNSEN